ncbi:MAG: hypothetical protein HC884_18850 [Chloroflexaceae bacterium]|nr:hypothetical protein [Chloroflexaceae bacterium]
MAEGKEPRSKRRGASKPAARGKTSEQKGTALPRGRPEPRDPGVGKGRETPSQEPSPTEEEAPGEKPMEEPAGIEQEPVVTVTTVTREDGPDMADIGETSRAGDVSDHPPVAEHEAEPEDGTGAAPARPYELEPGGPPPGETPAGEPQDTALAAIQEQEARLRSEIDALRQRVTELGTATARQETSQQEAARQEQVTALTKAR